MVPLLVIATVVAVVLVDLVVLAVSRRRGASRAAASEDLAAIAPESVSPPAGVFVDKGHTWLALEADGDVRVGATALLLRAFGAPDAVEVPTDGQKVRRGEPLFSIRVGERKATFRSPVDGVVVGANPALRHTPARLWERPFEEWVVTLRGEDLAPAISEMSVAERAAEWMRREYGRLQDALVHRVRGGSGALPQMADGGALLEGALSRLASADAEAVLRAFLHPAGAAERDPERLPEAAEL